MSTNHTLILAHGAGLPMDSDWMNALTTRFEKNGVKVIRFEFPYMEQRRIDGIKRPPNKIDILLKSYKDIVSEHTGLVFIGGKSMGGRVATMVANSCANVRGVIAFGYPFHPPANPEKLRTEHLLNIKIPCLIVQGEKDPFGKAEEWDGFGLSNSVNILPIAEANHDLKPLKRTGLCLQDALDLSVNKTIEFMDKYK